MDTSKAFLYNFLLIIRVVEYLNKNFDSMNIRISFKTINLLTSNLLMISKNNYTGIVINPVLRVGNVEIYKSWK